MSVTVGTPAWQRGYELGHLRRLAGVFKERHKALVFGAFGLVKERDVAAALADKHLVHLELHDEVQACALAHKLKTASTHHDFSGRELKLGAGTVFASAFACRDPYYGSTLLAMLRRLAAPHPLVVEAFEEDQSARLSVQQSGLVYCATKISAGSELKGLYSSSPTLALAPISRAEAAALEVCAYDFAGLAERASAVREIREYEYEHGAMWAQHYSSYNKRQSWTAIALRGYDPADPSFIIAPREMAQGWKEANPKRLAARCDWTGVAARFPSTLALVDRIPGRKDRVRFMRLAAEGELTRHADITDKLAGVANGRLARIHIPLLTNDAVRFVAWDARGNRIERFLPSGALCFLDQRKPHAVVNRSAAERIHIVLDVESSPQLRQMLFHENEEVARC